MTTFEKGLEWDDLEEMSAPIAHFVDGFVSEEGHRVVVWAMVDPGHVDYKRTPAGFPHPHEYNGYIVHIVCPQSTEPIYVAKANGEGEAVNKAEQAKDIVEHGIC